MSPRPMPTHTYFVHDPESHAVKIGATKWLDRRLMTLQVGNPHRLVMLAAVPDPHLERVLHERYRGYRLTGEWYCDDAPGLLATIQGFAAKEAAAA